MADHSPPEHNLSPEDLQEALAKVARQKADNAWLDNLTPRNMTPNMVVTSARVDIDPAARSRVVIIHCDQPNVADLGEPTLFESGGWDLRQAGVASYNGGPPFPLQPIQRKLLACLIKANGKPVHSDRLKAACDSKMEQKTLEGHLSRLRGAIREGARLEGEIISSRYPSSYQLLHT